ncbi:putative exosome complex subunit Rrp46 [Aspergillus clavatus NRRL 1]|uniref:Exosome complex subunit Rrp46, putative n=1 Tax=Aspergillus clavatus (strain ATCC 1007 / CBS 513.65 / DSM 816 / NCTC 3887 / NRRL 1 / QM 1276 / 107) TaxID=344612 RepID=A1CFK7_ASPCL|nr:exosome complex subunit Rrp46, putative [Aspergillus clavatus NRRL 1]EAW11656.1 exosome complex subunit Rrp46, putative [Aspergillus clavatus NRRL 1]
MVGPAASLTPLARADGSASYQCPTTGYSILGSVNAPIELPGRRDALKPEEATVEVFVKPGTTPGGVGERYVEGIIKSMLGRIILGREKGYPRRGVVVTLAIVGGQSVTRGDSYLTLLPALLQASLLALLSAAVPLSMTFTATVLAVTAAGDIVPEPSIEQAATAKSLHALAFSSKGHLLLNESQGKFDFDTWDKVHERASAICHGTGISSGDGDVAMAGEDNGQNLEKFVRETVEDKLYSDYAWKIDAA